MKRTLQTLALGLLTFASYAQDVNIPDDNFKASLVANININTNQDSEIQLTEAAVYTGGIAVGGVGISDLTGIEAFTEIRSLHAFSNQLTSVDLSSNAKITQLLLENNKDLAGDLDLSHMTLLTDLKIHTTDLTKVNLANGNNINITRFDFAKCDKLTCIQVDEVAYSSNNWPIATTTPLASFNTDCGKLYCYRETVDTTVCEGTSYTFIDQTTETINESTTYTHEILGSNGCDSLITTTITVLTINTVTPSLIGGNLCNGTDLVVKLNTSETDVNYTLKNSTAFRTVITGVIAEVTGTGNNINFPNFDNAEDLTLNVYAEKTENGITCNKTMPTLVHTRLVKNSVPSIITPIICQDGTAEVSVKYSVDGYRYTLMEDGTNTVYSTEVEGDGEEIILTSTPIAETTNLRVYATNERSFILARAPSVSFTTCSTDLEIKVVANITYVNTQLTLQPDSSLRAIQGNASYKWYTGCSDLTQTLIENETAASYLPTATTSEEYRAEVTVKGGCSAYTECFSYLINGINDNQVKTIAVSPNPTQDFIRFETDKKVTEISFYNTSGTLVKTEINNTNEVNVSNLTIGMYLIQIQTENGLLMSKFIKE